MTEANIEVVRACFQAWDRGDVDGVVANYADHVEVDASRIMEGVYRGRAAVRAYFQGIVESFRFANEDLKLTPVEDAVIATARLAGTGTASQLEVETSFAYRFEISGGLVERVVFYADPDEPFAEASSVAP